MKKMLSGWATFLSMPFSIIGGYKIVLLADVNQAVQIFIFIFGIAVSVFQFIIACTLIVQGYNDRKIRTPFDNEAVNEALLKEQNWKTRY